MYTNTNTLYLQALTGSSASLPVFSHQPTPSHPHLSAIRCLTRLIVYFSWNFQCKSVSNYLCSNYDGVVALVRIKGTSCLSKQLLFHMILFMYVSTALNCELQ